MPSREILERRANEPIGRLEDAAREPDGLETTAGARALCLQLASLPPGARSRAHLHAEHESAAYVVEGEMVLRFGDQLEEKVVARPGDFLYIPSGVPHLVANGSDSEPAVAVLARTDPDAQESVTELPELDALPHLRAQEPA